MIHLFTTLYQLEKTLSMNDIGKTALQANRGGSVLFVKDWNLLYTKIHYWPITADIYFMCILLNIYQNKQYPKVQFIPRKKTLLLYYKDKLIS